MVKKDFKKYITKKNCIIPVITLFMIVFIYFLAETGGLFSKKEDITLEIPSGMTFTEITDKLHEEEIIGNKFLFKIYAKLAEKDALNNIEAGKVVIGKNSSYSDVTYAICHKERFYDSIYVLIPEGFNLKQIKERLIYHNLIDPEKFDDAVKNYDFDYEFIKELEKTNTRLEGYLFPDTYMFTEHDDEISILNTMLAEFEEHIKNFEGQINDSEYSLHETVILASIIEKEGGNAKDYKLVSSVFHNRLKRTDHLSHLQSCATVQYLLNEAKPVLSLQDISIDSPYNTYKYPGLPAGPIASPGLSAFDAAVNPAETNYLYFQNDKNGILHFTDNYDEHMNNIKNYQ